jgi:hypothetical protein
LILDKPEHSLQRVGLAGEKQFKIALSSKIYSMLSDKLYTDRIGSVVREVCSNAWDGMKMKSLATGQPIEPFRVTLPTELEPHFIVEDFGVGMKDEDAQNLYSTLGLSTKEDTNDQIGAFGLGSKSPFAVTDTFTVENTYDGVTYYYLCFKSEDGLPSILPTGKKVEDRPNGVKVIIPSSGQNYNSYKNALVRQLVAMEPKPIITNRNAFEFLEPDKISENEFGYLLGNASQLGLKPRTIYARMGMVLYPVDLDQIHLSYSDAQTIRGLNLTTCLVLHLPIGAVEPLPSREGLTYDSRTINNIKGQFNSYRKIYKKQLIDEVNQKATPLEAYNEIIKIKSQIGIDIMTENIHINGWPVNMNVQPNLFPTFEHQYLYTPPPMVDDQGVLLPDQPQPELRKQKESQFIYEAFDPSDLRLNIKRQVLYLSGMRYSVMNQILEKKIQFLLMDEIEPKHRISRMKSVLNKLNYGESCFVVRVNPLYTGSQTDFSEFVKSLDSFLPGEKVVNLFSSVVKPESIRSERKVKDADGILEGVTYWTGFHEDYVRPSSLDKLSKNDNFESRACYVKMHRNDLVDYPDLKIEKFKNLAKVAGLHLFLVKAGGLNKIDDLSEYGITEFKVCIDNLLKDSTPDDASKKRNSCRTLVAERTDWFKYQRVQHIYYIHDELKKDLHYIPPFLSMCKEILDINNGKVITDPSSQMVDALKIQGLFKLFEDRPWAKELVIDLTTDFDKLEEEFNKLYPLVWRVINLDHSYSNTELSKILYQYVVDYNHLASLVATPIVNVTQTPVVNNP